MRTDLSLGVEKSTGSHDMLSVMGAPWVLEGGSFGDGRSSEVIVGGEVEGDGVVDQNSQVQRLALELVEEGMGVSDENGHCHRSWTLKVLKKALRSSRYY